jgi:DnaJ-class molecular chaperone
MKECHPDKFQGDETGLKAAEEKSKQVIEAYHFLVSINPETKAELTRIHRNYYNAITDYKFVEGRLIINFQTVAFMNTLVCRRQLM